MSEREQSETPDGDTKRDGAGRDAGSEDGTSEGDSRSARERMAEALHAFRESIEETISEARGRGDVSAEKAKEMFRTAADRARSATADAREKFDFVTHGEFEDLAERVARLEAKLAERIGGSGDSEGEGEGTDGS
jgi:hypothetical protein